MRQVAAMGFLLNFDYFNPLIKLSCYFPKNNRKRKTMCLHLSLKLQFVLSLCHQLISLITTIICSLDTFLVSYMDSCYTVQQILFPSECISPLYIRASVQQAPLSWKFYRISSVNIWMSSK